jgi:hypothetical protein
MEFPFVFGKVVTGPQFINRKKELAKLKANIDHGIRIDFSKKMGKIFPDKVFIKENVQRQAI